MSEQVKGKLSVERIGSKLFIVDDKDFSVTKVRYSKKAEANADEIVRRWNAFEKSGLVDELRTACEESQKAIMLLYECNKEVEISLGSGIQLKKAEKLLEAALAKS